MGSHISIVAYLTDDELRSKLTKVEMTNGFANPFLFARVRRSKELPHGGPLDPRISRSWAIGRHRGGRGHRKT
jgi:hypothetical protein